ncbi:ciliogenesis and planar polarity effector 1 [Discoglossus pictus]
MEVSLEVLVSTNIKRKKPCPRISWLGHEKESVFLVDEKHISEINLRSGNVKKTTPQLQALLKKKNIAVLATSLNGAWLAGLLLSGELFIWNKDLDTLQTVPANEEISQLVTAAQDNVLKVFLCVSGDGKRVLLASHIGSVFLWERTENKNLPMSPKSPCLPGSWTQIQSQSTILFPSLEDKEATVHAIFVQNEVLGDCCLCTFAFYSGDRLRMTFLNLRWYENHEIYNCSSPYHIHWTQQDCSLHTLSPSCEVVKSKGALLASFCRDGLLLAIAVNQRDPKATHILFINPMNFVTISGHLKGCSSKDQSIPSRLKRSYWVGDMAWTADSLFLACVLKRGALVLLTHLGELLTITTFGCSVEFGPAEFIPLHPLITYRPPLSILDCQDANNSFGSAVSDADILRQRYSVACHPRLPYLIVSDGYMVTALRFAKNFSSCGFMKSLLLDSAQRLENVRQRLQLVKPTGHAIKLRSLSSLKAGLLKDKVNPYSTMSTVPSFLQGEDDIYDPVGHSSLQGDNVESDDQDVPKSSVTSEISFGRADQGRLEFASMFDTIHADAHSDGQRDVSHELQLIQKALLTAWAVGVTMRNTEEKDTLLNYNVGCLTHFLAILQHYKHDTFSQPMEKASPWILYLSIFKQCLTVLYWDTAPRPAMGHMIKLTSEAIKLILLQPQQVYSKNLLESFCLLNMISQHLNAIYTLHHENVSVSTDMNSTACLDTINIPIFVSSAKSFTKEWSASGVLQQPPGPVNLIRTSEKRLVVLWRLLYNQTLWYQTRLRQNISANHKPLPPKVLSEEEAVESLLCHIQLELQSAGERLDQSLHLLPVGGEEYFLLGSYQESVEFWRQALQEITAQGGRRASLLQTRYYLAVLYCHLYNYNLNDAQGMCDHLVKELLRRSNLLSDTMQDIPGGSEWILEDVHHEAALAVIQSMGRFMSAYFTNQLLYVFPPHNVNVLAPLHLNLTSGRLPRVVTLQHSVVASVVRDQNLSSIWTVEYALDLLLIGGLVPEAAWLANKLGDWKMAVSMGVAYNLFQKSSVEEIKITEMHLPLTLTPAHIFLEKLQSFLGRPPGSDGLNKDGTGQKQFTDPIEEEDADLLFSSVQEMLKAAVMADAEIFTDTFHQLMEAAKEISRKLPGLVPERLYLPAPPLYCPQPAAVSEDDPSDLALASEKLHRQKLSGVLQRILLLLRAARCSLPAAQWYIKQIKRARKVMQKIRAKGSLPPLNVLPDTLLNYSNSSTPFLKPGPSGDHQPDQVSSKVLGYFRELCGLCWMLHVRERLSYSCRQYQKARDNGKLFKGPEEYDSCEMEHCFKALEWACRMLPFTRATNCEELIQDVILSLVSELPPVRKVAEILVKAFPNPDDVRVPLREKYHSVQQRLRHSMVKGPEGEEMMSVIIHNVQRQRVKTLKRVQRNIGPVELHMWEPALGEASDEELHYYDRLSLGTSLSRSTLTDFGRPHVYSDADTLSEVLMNGIDESSEWHVAENKYDQKTRENKPVSENRKTKSEVPNKSEQILPIVGTWEFESDDEEYTNFLDLFLSYLLERDLLHYSEPGIPFLTSFSHHLREHELNSLVFDVHTTLKRKLGRPKIQSVYRAGCCYTVNAESFNESMKLAATGIQTQGTSTLLPNSTIVLEKPESSSFKYFNKAKTRSSAKSGLFGLREQSMPKLNDDIQNRSLSTPVCELQANNQYSYRMIQVKDRVPSEELGEQLQAKFSNESKLVEWMVRWSDKRLFWSAGKAQLCHVQSTAIRAKASSAAILTSLWLLEKPYMGGAHNNINFMVPPREYIVAPVFNTESELRNENIINNDNKESEGGSAPVVEEHFQEPEDVLIPQISTNLPGRNEQRSPVRPPTALSDDKSVNYSVHSENTDNTIVEPIPLVSETEDDQDEQLDTQRSPTISINIRPVSHEHEETLSSETGKNTQESENPVIPKPAEQPQNSEPAVASSQTPVQCLSSVASVLTMAPTNVNHQGGEQPIQPANTSEAVRQLFQDEMFRLLQLQQINFMSLMQVVGSSFAALPAMQQILQQSSQAIGNQWGHHAVGPTTVQFQAPLQGEIPHRDVAQTNERPTNERADTVESTSVPVDTVRDVNKPSNNENTQNVHGLKISLSDAYNGGTIPANQGLLTTASSQGLPIIHPASGVQKTPILLSTTKVSSNFNGFPLLKIQSDHRFFPMNIIPRNMGQNFPGSATPPLPREAWGPTHIGQKIPSSQKPTNRIKAPSHADQNEAKDLKRPQERVRWAESVVKEPKKHPPIDQYSAQTKARVQSSRMQENGKRHQSMSLQDTPHSATGIHLLHLREDPVPYIPPVISSNVRAPVMQLPSREKPVSFKPLPQTSLTLLKTNLSQQMQSLPVGSAPKLIPLQNLLAFERSRGLPGTAEGTLQLLKANIKPFEEVVKPNDSIKRQKRRTQQEKGDKNAERKDKKSSVTFRPEDSIIIPNNFDEIVQIKDVKHEQPVLQKSKDFVIPIGSFESLLSEKIPETQITSVAELHFMASTKKKAPEIQDASTNTDTANRLYQNIGTVCEDLQSELPSSRPAASYSAADLIRVASHSAAGVPTTVSPSAAIVASAASHSSAGLTSAASHSAAEKLPTAIPPVLPPDLYLNLRFPNVDLEERSAPPQTSGIPAKHVGHHYINVIDIDTKDLLKDLPYTEVEEPPPVERLQSRKVPSSAELHYVAASVTNSISPRNFQSTENVMPQTSEKRPRLEEPVVSTADPVTYSLLSGGIPPLELRTTSARDRGTDRAFSKLKEMDEQLAAIETMANNMEQEFADTELLVNTIENLATAIDPSPEGIIYSTRGVGVTEKALRLSQFGLEDVSEEDEFTSPSPAAIRTSGDQISSQIQPRDKRTDAASAQNGNSERSLLNVTGLSDIADILGDLMDGGISASELGLTETQAKMFSRETPQNTLSRHTGKRSDKERTELQIWMKKKQQERLAEHRKQLDALREMEHDPFQPKHNANVSVSSKALRQSQRLKHEKDKSLLSEHHNHRVSDALTLMQEMLSDAKHIPAVDLKTKPSPSRTSGYRMQGVRSSPKGSSASKHNLSAGRAPKKRPPSRAQPRSISTPTRSISRETATTVHQKSTLDPKIRAKTAPSYPLHLKYDASLPGDRMSQITRRGLLSGRNNANVIRKTNTKFFLDSSARHAVPHRQGARSKDISIQHVQAEEMESERDVTSPWEVPDEIKKILNMDSNHIPYQGTLFDDNHRKVDNSSESTGSILSKLDWNAIEDMVASLENT